MAIPDDGLLPVSEMQENLEPLEYSDNEASNEERRNVRLTKATFGSASTWIPSRSSIVGSNYLSRLKSDSAGFKNFYRQFNGKRCKLSVESMRIITAFTLHNTGGSDEGTAFTLAAAFWVASIEMGKPLSPEQLGHGCPSESVI